MTIRCNIIRRILLYSLGMTILALGLTLNTKTNLGVSPILSIPYALSEMTSISFPDLVFLAYCLFILIQILIHIHLKQGDTKHILAIDCSQILVSMIFTRIMALYSMWIPIFDLECTSFFQTMPFRFLMLILAIVCTGIGAALTLDMKLIANPGDGVVAALAQLFKMPVGTCKNYVDISCVLITLFLSYWFNGHIIGIGIGTLIAMIGVGRVINIFNQLFSFSLNHYEKEPE